MATPLSIRLVSIAISPAAITLTVHTTAFER
jgi:hypothetical protein